MITTMVNSGTASHGAVRREEDFTEGKIIGVRGYHVTAAADAIPWQCIPDSTDVLTNTWAAMTATCNDAASANGNVATVIVGVGAEA